MVEAFQDWISLNRYMLKMFKMLVLTLLLGHISACGWALFGVISEEENDTAWFMEAGAIPRGWDNANLGTKYLAAGYWAVTTVTTVGCASLLPPKHHHYLYSHRVCGQRCPLPPSPPPPPSPSARDCIASSHHHSPFDQPNNLSLTRSLAALALLIVPADDGIAQQRH